ncbi:MAG: zf-HC2 domain-containing protein [Chloroflexi bacterium]|nr:zf-HC2 domain-containing protein [Chloroflexota bacterium]
MFSFSGGKRNCHRIQKLFSAYISGQLPDNSSSMVVEHIKDCAFCRQELESLKNTANLLQQIQDVPSPTSFAIKGKIPVKAGFLDRISINLVQQVAISLAVIMIAVFMYDLSGNVVQSTKTKDVVVAQSPGDTNSNVWVWPVIIVVGVALVATIGFYIYLKRRKKKLRKLKRYGKV